MMQLLVVNVKENYFITLTFIYQILIIHLNFVMHCLHYYQFILVFYQNNHDSMLTKQIFLFWDSYQAISIINHKPIKEHYQRVRHQMIYHIFYFSPKHHYSFYQEMLVYQLA